MLQLDGSQEGLRRHGYGNCAPEKQRQAVVLIDNNCFGIDRDSMNFNLYSLDL